MQIRLRAFAVPFVDTTMRSNFFWNCNLKLHLKSYLKSDMKSYLKSYLNSYEISWKIASEAITLVYRIDVHARLLILRKKSTLYGLILVCTFINFEKTFLPARLFHPARLLVSTFFHYCYFFAGNTEQQMTFIFQS